MAAIAALIAAPSARSVGGTRAFAISSAATLGTATTLVLHLTSDSPWNRATFSVPLGYTAPDMGRQTPGIAMSHVSLRAALASGEAVEGGGPGIGSVLVADPASHLADTCSPGRHEAVWTMNAPLDGRDVQIPVYVDDGGDDAGYAFRLTVCGDAGGGMRLTGFDLATKIFVNPRRAGAYVWRAQIDDGDYRSIATLPTTLRVSRVRRVDRGKAIVTGVVRSGGHGRQGVRVAVWSKRNSGQQGFALAHTNAKGSFTVRISAPKGRLRVWATVEAVPPATGLPCDRAAAPTCVAQSNYGTFALKSNVVRLRG